MRLDDECTLSYYKEIAALNDCHNVYLVQNIETKKIYVKKILTIYNKNVYNFLKNNSIKNIPCIYEVIEDGDKLIVIEEYINGTTLQEILDKEKVLDENKVFTIISQLCKILLEMHKLQPPIVHRDIKPSNIMISSDGVVKLIDLNAAKLNYNYASRDTELIGTVGFAAPEQYGFASSCAKTDIYSLGVLINIMLTGVLPQERLARDFWGDIVSRCTKIDPKERYESIDDIICVLNNEECKNVEHKYNRIYDIPGFRNNSISKKLFALIGYVVLIIFAFSFEMKDVTMQVLWFNRISYAIIFILLVLFFGDYMNIQEKTGVKRIKNIILRVVITLLQGFTILVTGMIIMSIIESFIK